ncbi:MAG: aminotransferase class IV, partial [Bacteroidota bacterium]
MNRSFRYGDGIFESIRVFNGKMPFLDRHWRRLSAGMQALRLEAPPHFTQAFFKEKTLKTIENQGNWRVRLIVFRSGGGLYTPEKNEADFLIEASPLAADNFEWQTEGLHVGICETVKLTPSIFSPFKTCSALPFVLAGIFKKENRLDDCLLLNQTGRIVCGGSSNLFLVENGRLFTPPISEGCVAGVIRSAVLDVAKALKIKVKEAKIPTRCLAQADEIFLTNAVQGIRWVRQLKGMEKTFTCKTASLILEKL